MIILCKMVKQVGWGQITGGLKDSGEDWVSRVCLADKKPTEQLIVCVGCFTFQEAFSVHSALVAFGQERQV